MGPHAQETEQPPQKVKEEEIQLICYDKIKENHNVSV